MKKITQNTTLKKILDIKGSDEVLAKHGVPCLSCPMASLEVDRLKIGDVCKAYDLDIDRILEELNKI